MSLKFVTQLVVGEMFLNDIFLNTLDVSIVVAIDDLTHRHANTILVCCLSDGEMISWSFSIDESVRVLD